MSTDITALTDSLHAYYRTIGFREPDILARLRAETEALPEGSWRTAPEEGQVLAFLVQLTGARRILEVGTFTGYGTLAMGLAMAADANLVTCDMSPEWTGIGSRYWREAGIEDRIDLRLAPALETLKTMEADGAMVPFDMIFIDADKKEYDAYYESAVRLVRPGGLIAVDNVLWKGRVVEDSDVRNSTLAIRALNEKIHADQRVTMVMIPMCDGLTLARKRAE